MQSQIHYETGNSQNSLRITAIIAGIAIIMMALSISLTHLFIALSFLSLLIDKICRFIKIVRCKDFGLVRFKLISLSIGLNPLLSCGFLLFFILLISATIHSLTADNFFDHFQKGVSAELSDLPLFLFGVLIYYLSKNIKNRKILLLAIEIFIILLIISGIVAVFSKFRLAKMVMGAGFVPSAINRPQHLFYSILGIELYQPLGFMNTRLTYGGLLVLILPLLFHRLITGQTRGNYFKRIFTILLFCAGILLLIVNQTRSAQFGVLFGLLTISLINVKRFQMRKMLLTISFLLFLIFFLFILLPERGNMLIVKLMNLASRHTDSFRPIIWSGAGEIILQNPVLGIGPGGFSEATVSWRNLFLERHPMVWYFFQNAPSGHAHNDLLHITAIAGIPGGIAFLILTGSSFWNLLQTKSLEARNFVFGIISLFPAGIFQCYFQDDEVVVLFWTMVGLSAGWKNVNLYNSHSNSDH